MDFGKSFMRQGMLLEHLLCERVKSVEKFAANPRHFPSQEPQVLYATNRVGLLSAIIKDLENFSP